MPDGNERGRERLPLPEKLAVQLAARALERGRQGSEPHARRFVGCVQRRFVHLSQQDVPILQLSEQHLNAPHDRGLLRRVGRPELGGDLQRVAKLLRREPHAVEPLGNVNRSRRDRRETQVSCAPCEPCRKQAPPRGGVVCSGVLQQACDDAIELPGAELLQPPEQPLATFFPRAVYVLPGFGERAGRHRRGERSPLEQRERHVHFADAAEPLRQPADSFLPSATRDRHQREHFPQPS